MVEKISTRKKWILYHKKVEHKNGYLCKPLLINGLRGYIFISNFATILYNSLELFTGKSDPLRGRTFFFVPSRPSLQHTNDLYYLVEFGGRGGFDLVDVPTKHTFTYTYSVLRKTLEGMKKDHFKR